MKIKLLKDIPVNPMHGLRKGRTLDATDRGSFSETDPRWFVKGDAGHDVGIWPNEAEIVTEDPDA